MEEIKITVNEKELELLQKIIGIGVYNGNHIEPKAYNPNGEEYKILCQLFNKTFLPKRR